MIVILMGVSGSGKTTIGEALARELGWRFIDADDHHPKANVAKMARGEPLDDADRWPWLERLNQVLRGEDNAVLACSALKERYRARLAHGVPAVKWVHLHADPALLRARLERRQHRYMPASLLESQLAALEPPREAIAIDVAHDVAASVAAIAAKLRH